MAVDIVRVKHVMKLLVQCNRKYIIHSECADRQAFVIFCTMIDSISRCYQL